MSQYEKYIIIIYILQTVIFLMTFLGALFIGFKQNQINKQLLELNQLLSIQVLHVNHELRIYNKSRGVNVWFWGSQITQIENSKSVESSPRLIAPEFYYYLPTKSLENAISNKLQISSEATFNMELFMTNDLKQEFAASLILFVQKSEQDIKIHTQILSIAKQNWS
jgi:hypothetical protein